MVENPKIIPKELIPTEDLQPGTIVTGMETFEDLDEFLIALGNKLIPQNKPRRTTAILIPGRGLLSNPETLSDKIKEDARKRKFNGQVKSFKAVIKARTS